MLELPCVVFSFFQDRKRMKVVNLKQAILQAWKERWSDYQWAINMKKFFPKGTTWDILNLAGLVMACAGQVFSYV